MILYLGVMSPQKPVVLMAWISLQGSCERYTLLPAFYCVNLQRMAMLSNRRQTIEKENSNRHEIPPSLKNSFHST